MTDLQGFALFSKLPSELRELIWNAALPPPRLVAVEERELEPVDVRDEMLYEEDCYGRDTIEDDTRSVPEKDMRLLVHKISYGQNGCLKLQSQLHKYGFESNKPTPDIAHVPFHDPETYQGFGEYEVNPIRPSRDVRSLSHGLETFRGFPGRNQTQLHRYNFTSSRPCPLIDHVPLVDIYCWERPSRFYSYSPVPALLHVCRESRQQAIRSGYSLSFSSQWAPAQIWFNFRTDYLRLPSYYFEFPSAFHAKDRRRVMQLALTSDVFEDPTNPSHPVRQFENLKEIVIILADTFPIPDHDWVFVDCTCAESLNDNSRWHVYGIELVAVCAYIKARSSGPLFYNPLLGNMESYMTSELELVRRKGGPEFKIPKFRYVIATDAQGERDLHAVRSRYWGEREEQPASQDYRRFQREDMDAKIVARPPSPFDMQYADDIEVDDELFRESVRANMD